MKIRDRRSTGVSTGTTGSVGHRGRTGGSGPAGASRAPEPSDRLHISGRGVEIQRARSLALQAPEVREELVDEITGAIARGEYTVTGADVTPKLIREHAAMRMGEP